MRAFTLVIVAACGLFVAGCSSGPTARGSGPEAVGGISTPTRSTWSRYVQVMTDKERMEFLDIEDTAARHQWLRRNGIDVRADLDRKLSRGISVESAKRRIEEIPEEVSKRGDTTMLFYSRYNTESRTNFWLLFKGDQLVNWNAHTIAQMDRERHLLNFQSDLMAKFDTVLHRGMGMNEIVRQANNARDHLNRAENVHREALGSPDYKGVRSVSSANYLIAEDLLYARTRLQLYEWFRGRTPDHTIRQGAYETHQYFTTFTDVRGNETIVIVEFIFMNGLLENWFVFHER